MSASRDFTASGLPEKLVHAATTTFPTAGVTFYRWESASRLLVPAAANEQSRVDGLAPRRLGVGASGRAAIRRRPVIAGDYAVAFADATPAARAGVVAAMSAPLFANGELLGTISVGLDKPASFFGCDDLATLIELQSRVLPMSNSLRRQAAAVRIAELEALCDAHHRAALGLAFTLVGNIGLAEQVVQDVLLIAWRAGSTAEPGVGAARPWLLAMVRARVAKLHVTASSQGLSGLGDEARVIDLICLGGLPYSEVAEWLGMSATCVASTVRHALDQLPTTDRGSMTQRELRRDSVGRSRIIRGHARVGRARRTFIK